MAIPSIQTVQLPLLKLLSDQKEHALREVIEKLESQFGLSEDDKKQTTPVGLRRTIYTRVSWAVSQLRHAGLLENTRLGVFKITSRGLTVLEQNPAKIDNNLLKQFPEFLEYIGAAKDEGEGAATKESIETSMEKAPVEILEESYQKMRRDLADRLLDEVKSCTPAFFEKLVVKLLVKMGYGGSEKDAGQAIGGSGDGGVDGVIKEDPLGLDVIYIQAKRYDGNVNPRLIREFAGALQGHRAKKGIFITTGKYSKEAEKFPSSIENKIILIDGNRLAELMIDYNIGVAPEKSYETKRIDQEFFGEDA